MVAVLTVTFVLCTVNTTAGHVPVESEITPLSSAFVPVVVFPASSPSSVSTFTSVAVSVVPSFAPRAWT